MIDINGKLALVTGASRGVGLRISKALADQGCNLILHARTLEATEYLAAELLDTGITVHQVAAELSDFEEVMSLIAEIKGISAEGIDILYNNAAIMSPYMESMVVPAKDYLLSFKVNSIVPAILCDAFLPGMLTRNWGRIVNVTSGIDSQPQLMAYSCSKAALDRYVRDMVPRLAGSNVLMNLMDPGWLRTDLGGPQAPNDPDSVSKGALVPVRLEKSAGSGKLYQAQEYV
ncbi:MAG: SDR family NAD(P)-dependent oxidoreductase [Spirochaetaceae bacterium]|jgi:3-oxoacyl-[acyl-carrier protein] reductase|nr:SDR family NAD(P)-dependent oxidoreductase [Spirochaetaceae bacterium]